MDGRSLLVVIGLGVAPGLQACGSEGDSNGNGDDDVDCRELSVVYSEGCVTECDSVCDMEANVTLTCNFFDSAGFQYGSFTVTKGFCDECRQCLPEWEQPATGTGGGSGSGGSGGSGGCIPTNGAIEACDGLDNDCNGEIDETFDLANDVHNCGVCLNDCSLDVLAATSATCEALPGMAGYCLGTTCAPDYHDLDRDMANGCEYYCVRTSDVDSTCDGRDDDCDGIEDDDLVSCSPPEEPEYEVCNCMDDDGDFEVDDDPEPGSSHPPLCSPGKACVAYQAGCQCAAPCGDGEFPCPTGGFRCEPTQFSMTGDDAGARCVLESR